MEKSRPFHSRRYMSHFWDNHELHFYAAPKGEGPVNYCPHCGYDLRLREKSP
jgi:hypothetical protein